MQGGSIIVSSAFVLIAGCTAGGTSVEDASGGGGTAPTGAVNEPGSFEAGAGADGLDAIVDADGVLHLAWWEGTSITGARLLSRSVPAGGEPAEPEQVAAGFEIVEADPELLLGPDGEPCVALEGWPYAGDISSEGLYLSCRSSGTWGDPTLVEQRGVTADYATSSDAAGSLHAIYISPPSSIAFGELELGDGSTLQHPAFVIDGSDAYHAIWQSLGSPGGLIYRSSTDEGATWSEPETLSGDYSFARPPDLSVASDGTVHVFFASSDLFHDSGTIGAFGPPEKVAVGIGNVPSTGTVASDGAVHAFWTDAAGVQHAVRTDGTWSAPTLVPGTEGVVASDLATAVDSDGSVSVAWIEAGEPPFVGYATV